MSFKKGDKVFVYKLYDHFGDSYSRNSPATIIEVTEYVVHIKYVDGFWQKECESVHLDKIDMRLLTPLEKVIL